MEGMLEAKHVDESGIETPYFHQFSEREAEQKQISDLMDLKREVQKAVSNEIITEEIASYLVKDSPQPGRLYGMVKDHVIKEKWAPGSKIPPLRPVESASGTTFENVSEFVDIHSNYLVKELPSYVEDTPDLLRQIQDMNDKGPQPTNTIPVTLDVASLYTNIPIQEGINIFKSFLDSRTDKTMPTIFLITLLTFVLSCNVLTFDKKFFLQLVGCAMGSRVAPTFACLFLGAIEKDMLAKWWGIKPIWYKRYIDDIFLLWNGDEKSLKEFISYLNSFHPYLKFKATYDFSSKSVEFLDTVISIDQNNYIQTTLFTKPGKKCTYLSPASCHPSFMVANIPYSLGLRLKRICSNDIDFLKHLDILKNKLTARGYKVNSILKSFEKVKLINRREALQKVDKKIINRPILPLSYDPRLPNISNIIYRFWKIMVENPRLKILFPQPPMICWKRPKNLKEFLVRARMPPEIQLRRSERDRNGFYRCSRPACITCSYVPSTSVAKIRSSKNQEEVKIMSKLSCESSNVIYIITCKNCKEQPQYVGETGRRLADRFLEHRRSVINFDMSKAVGAHFNDDGHIEDDMQVVAIEQLRSNDPWTRKIREKFYIRLLDCQLNKNV